MVEECVFYDVEKTSSLNNKDNNECYNNIETAENKVIEGGNSINKVLMKKSCEIDSNKNNENILQDDTKKDNLILNIIDNS